MLSEVRKYRLNLSLANQNYGQIDERIKQALGNAEMIAVKLNRDDAVWMALGLNPLSFFFADMCKDLPLPSR